ncbi:MAG: S-layer homology domain-containing protein, partial [Butyricicoccus sp.]|nr:S-layer homology domain-containing protein [Butyricicoccus sp.]
MKKKLITLCLCLCLAVTMLSGTALAAGTKFSDVGANSYYATPVNWAVSEGITAGTGNGSTFSPDDTCTHAQILTFLWRAAGSPEKDFLYNPFDNISENAYYFKAAVWAYEKGMMTLTDDSGFEPNKACTRAATVEYLWRYAGRPSAQLVSFTDVSVNSSMIHSISWAVDHGVTAGTGSGSTFSPNETCTRGQIVTFLYRYFVEPLATTPAPAPAPPPAADGGKLDPQPPVDYT